MSILAFLALAAVTALLWWRVERLRREVAELRGGLPSLEGASPAAPASPAEPTAEPPAIVAAPAELGPASERLRLRLPGLDLEDLFGRLLPIWAGGVTLAVAGFFLVRWSIDAGLLTPPVRVALAGLFGVALLAGAEAAWRWRARVADPRVAQALAGAGLATLYAAFYLAGSAYGLIGSTVAFVGLAAVTAAAIALSFRFGLPSAVLGLVGGFAAPALVGSKEANLPLLTLYLALVTAGLALTGRRQQRAWLGIAALAGGLGWGALLLAGAAPRTPDAVVLGAYLVLLGAIVPAFSGGGGRPHWLVRVGAAGLAALQLAVLVQQGGFGGLEWGLYLLLGGALAWFGWREPAMREASAAAAAVGVALLALWPGPAPQGFALVGAELAAIFAGVPLAQIARGHGRALDFAQASGVALGLALAALGHFGSPLPEVPAPVMALALVALAGLPAAAAVLASLPGRAGLPRWLAAAQAVAALLGFAALAQVAPEDALAWSAAAAAALLAWRGRGLAGALATLAILAALWSLAPLAEWLRLGALALAGTPMRAPELPGLRPVALALLPAIAAGAAWTWAASPADRSRKAVAGLTIALAAIALHFVYRQVFASLVGADFAATGVIERAAWEALLLAIAALARSRGWRQVATAFALAALAHFGWFALVLHNPLWSAQAVGPVPLANALPAAYAPGLAALYLLRRWLPPGPTAWRWAVDAAAMAAIALLALSLLRQAFAGSLLAASAMTPGEDLLRSLIGIVLAIGFLLWGARTGERSWRIGSLVLMVIAVLKVFLVDAAGLAGLARIASFMALGFSLIGIGWFYTRQLRPGLSST